MVHQVVTVDTNPYEGQKPGTSGLRKPTKIFLEKPNYTANFVQCILDCIDDKSCLAIDFIIKICAGNGVKRLIIGQNDTSNGGPAPEGITDKIFKLTKEIKQFKTVPDLSISIDEVGTQEVVIGTDKMIVEIIEMHLRYGDRNMILGIKGLFVCSYFCMDSGPSVLSYCVISSSKLLSLDTILTKKLLLKLGSRILKVSIISVPHLLNNNFESTLTSIQLRICIHLKITSRLTLLEELKTILPLVPTIPELVAGFLHLMYLSCEFSH
uniref:Uncharacterized protein n=1 Tax=Tetranychus urticae TaxID=32264 RepID=T1K746_TETUR